MVGIQSDYTGPVLNRNGMVPDGITFISASIWYQIADPIRTGSTRSRVNTRLIHTKSLQVPKRSGFRMELNNVVKVQLVQKVTTHYNLNLCELPFGLPLQKSWAVKFDYISKLLKKNISKLPVHSC